MEPANCLVVEDYEHYERTMKFYVTTYEHIYLYFFGRRNEKGVSWCPDCNQSYDNILKARDLYAKPDSIFISVDVGTQEEFRDPLNKFRQDATLKIKVVPTLIKWKSPKRLEDGHFCSNLGVLELFFGDEDE